MVLHATHLLFTAFAWGANPDPAPPTPPPAEITFERAKEIALGHVPGGVVESIELDRAFGRGRVYEVDVRAPDGCEHELTLAARDGKLLERELDCD